MAFITDIPDYVEGYQEAGWGGVVYEVGQTGLGVGGAAALAWIGARACPGGPWVKGACAVVGGFLGYFGAEEIYVRVAPSPYD